MIHVINLMENSALTKHKFTWHAIPYFSCLSSTLALWQPLSTEKCIYTDCLSEYPSLLSQLVTSEFIHTSQDLKQKIMCTPNYSNKKTTNINSAFFTSLFFWLVNVWSLPNYQHMYLLHLVVFFRLKGLSFKYGSM